MLYRFYELYEPYIFCHEEDWNFRFSGAIIEHERQIKAIGHEPVIVKYPEQLEEIDGIILPGGESTTMGKILNRTGLMEPLRGKIQSGLPVWGTCAGMILLAKELVNDSVTHLGVMDIAVRRNAYGSQIDSFATKKVIPAVDSKEIELVFIRAPYITSVKDGVKILCELDGHIVAAEEKNMLVTSFHPELTDNTAFLKYFVSKI